MRSGSLLELDRFLDSLARASFGKDSEGDEEGVAAGTASFLRPTRQSIGMPSLLFTMHSDSPPSFVAPEGTTSALLAFVFRLGDSSPDVFFLASLFLTSLSLFRVLSRGLTNERALPREEASMACDVDRLLAECREGDEGGEVGVAGKEEEEEEEGFHVEDEDGDKGGEVGPTVELMEEVGRWGEPKPSLTMAFEMRAAE